MVSLRHINAIWLLVTEIVSHHLTIVLYYTAGNAPYVNQTKHNQFDEIAGSVHNLGLGD